jgi:hypothetical protein
MTEPISSIRCLSRQRTRELFQLLLNCWLQSRLEVVGICFKARKVTGRNGPSRIVLYISQPSRSLSYEKSGSPEAMSTEQPSGFLAIVDLVGNSEALSEACSHRCSQKLEVVPAHRLHLGRSRSDAAQLRADAKAGGGLAEK